MSQSSGVAVVGSKHLLLCYSSTLYTAITFSRLGINRIWFVANPAS